MLSCVSTLLTSMEAPTISSEKIQLPFIRYDDQYHMWTIIFTRGWMKGNFEMAASLRI
jgi:hypothetical protein